MHYLNFNYLDWIILFSLLITSIIGFNNGFIREFLNFLIWTLSIIISLILINKLQIYNLLDTNVIYSLIIFFILFLLSFIILKLIIFYFFSDLKNIFNSNYVNNTAN